MNTLRGLIMKYEGLYLRSYLCPAGVWTIGYGATGPGIGPNVIWTREQALDRLEFDMQKFWRAALKLSPCLALYPEIHEAIADFCFNLGTGRYKGSTLKRRVDVQDWDGACEEIVKWVYGGGRKLRGLVLRREAERAIIESGTLPEDIQ